MKKGKKLHGNKETVVKVCNWLSLPLQALGCCILYLVIEAFSRHSLASAWSYMVESPWVFLYNAFLIFTTFMVVYLFRRRVLVRLVMSCFWLLLGIINGVILANRVTPFTGPDLRNLSDGAKVVTKYLSKGTMILVVAACGIIGIFCMGLDQRTEISGENPLVSECAVNCSGNCTLYGSNESGACKACAFQLFRQHRICLPGLRLSVLSGSHPV